MKNYAFSVFFLFLIISNTKAQEFQLLGEIRPRFENRHGFKTLINTNDKAANFISQRSRLSFAFNQDKLTLGIDLQNIRVWGDVSTMNVSDIGSSFHQAWAKYHFTEKFSLKIGRQEILYDDSRIFGNVDWAQQARSFDAIIAQFSIFKKGELQIGYSLNNDKEDVSNTLYSNIAGYKSFQYLWAQETFNNLKISLLFLNNGIEYVNATTTEMLDYSQTFGARTVYKKDKIYFDTALYFQTGKSSGNRVDANYFAGNINYQFSEQFTIGFGTEYLSGKDTNDTSTSIKSFNPFYGTNHKFNGLMDYFYVGNHINSVGLVDVFTTFEYKKDDLSLKIVPHFFSSAANMYNVNSKLNSYLGTEIDFIFAYKIQKNIHFEGGFSKMFATKSLEFLKGGDRSENNYWTWLMISFKPKLYASK
jgi:hypothetical protein